VPAAKKFRSFLASDKRSRSIIQEKYDTKDFLLRDFFRLPVPSEPIFIEARLSFDVGIKTRNALLLKMRDDLKHPGYILRAAIISVFYIPESPVYKSCNEVITENLTARSISSIINYR
jgi:hypothetical protein